MSVDEDSKTIIEECSPSINGQGSISNQDQPESLLQKFGQFLNMLFGVEFGLFLYATAGGIFQPAQQTYVYQQICLFKYESEDLCSQISSSPDLAEWESAVQKDYSTYSNYSILFSTIPALFMTLVLGAWCDRFSIRLPIILAHIGRALCTAVLLMYPYFSGLGINPVYLGVASFFSGITGGAGSIIMATATYVSRISTGRDRTVRLARIEAANTLGSFSGYVIVAFLISSTGQLVAFLIQIAINLYAVVFVLAVIPEFHKLNDVKTKVKTEANGSWFRFLLAPQKDFIGGFFIIFGRSAKYAPQVRKYLIVMLLVYFVAISVAVGQASVQYEFLVKYPISMSPFLFSLFQALNTITISTSLLFGMKLLQRLFNLCDASFVVIGCISQIIGLLTLGFGQFYPTWSPWVSSISGMMCFYIFTPIRSGLSKLTDESEMGQIFSTVSLFEQAGVLLFTIGFNSLYATLVSANLESDTLNYLLQGFAINLGALLHIPILCLTIWLGRERIENWGFQSSLVKDNRNHRMQFEL